jgi:hypothetical protein
MVSEVDHPRHYNACGPKDEDGTAKFEVIKIIEDWGLGFCLGNALKYICRAPHKGKQIEDLEKALWYIRRACNHPETLKARSARNMHPRVVSKAWGLADDLGDAVVTLYDGDIHLVEAVLVNYIAELKASLVRPTESDNPLT